MNKVINVLIAIQARSTSTRFPRKIFEMIGDRRMLDHVIDRAQSASDHIMRHTMRVKIDCEVAVLHPEKDDEIVKAFHNPNVIFFGGSEEDVLSRYIMAQRMTDCDYIVRLTSDCPLIFSFIIAKHINSSAFSTLDHVKEGPIDYMSNIDEECRTVADGLDCEILSKQAIQWLDRNATSTFDREHVTTALRRERPPALRQAFCSMHLDTSSMKLSVDTPEDLERVRLVYETRANKTNVARRLFGNAVYEL